ncbi:DUF2922 domain-containing protein [bacterium LRH843]|nr:DUF2922 domain-containing protein [bacterium LRH843]
MSKRLDLIFENEEGRQVTVSLDYPIEPVDPELVASSMQAIINSNTLTSSGGDIVAIRSARIVEQNIETIELP